MGSPTFRRERTTFFAGLYRRFRVAFGVEVFVRVCLEGLAGFAGLFGLGGFGGHGLGDRRGMACPRSAGKPSKGPTYKSQNYY